MVTFTLHLPGTAQDKKCVYRTSVFKLSCFGDGLVQLLIIILNRLLNHLIGAVIYHKFVENRLNVNSFKIHVHIALVNEIVASRNNTMLEERQTDISRVGC